MANARSSMTPDDARIRLEDEEREGERFAPGRADLRLIDASLRDCDLSNVRGDGGTLLRVGVERSRLMGFTIEEGEVRGTAFTDCALSLASFARTTLREVRFERCDLSETSFMGARLIGVTFADCRLGGADFRDARVVPPVAISGASLDGVVGIEFLRGATMSWEDVVASAAALAATLGIEIESDDGDPATAGSG